MINSHLWMVIVHEENKTECGQIVLCDAIHIESAVKVEIPGHP